MFTNCENKNYWFGTLNDQINVISKLIIIETTRTKMKINLLPDGVRATIRIG